MSNSSPNLVQITSLLSVIIITGSIIYVYLSIKTTQNKRTTTTNNKINYADCPDFFETIEKDGTKYCKNTYNLGNSNNNEGNKLDLAFEDEDLFTNNEHGNLMKCKWTKNKGIPWNGIDRLC